MSKKAHKTLFSIEPVKCLSKKRFESALEAIVYYGGKVVVKRDFPQSWY